MEVELFVHGVPNGIDYWGKEDDHNYFNTFYDNSSDEIKFLIQTRLLKGKAYCYYNYLVYKTIGSSNPNIVAYDGRDGSYFGITLRLDAYCKEYDNMYRILDTIYNVYIVGSLLKMEKSKLKYTTPNFASVSSTLDSVEQATIQLIKNAFTNESFTRLESFATNGGQYPAFNLFDCTWEKVMSAIKQYSRVALSPYYPSSKEVAIQQQCDAQIKVTQQQYEAQLKAKAETYDKEKNEISKSLSSEKNLVSQLQGEIKQKEGTISQLNNEISRLQLELKNAGQSKKIAQLIAPIAGPISELSGLLERIAPETHNNSDEYGVKPKRRFGKILCDFIPFLNFIVLIGIVSILLNPSKFSHKAANAVPAEVIYPDSTKQEQQLENQTILSENIGSEVIENAVPSFDINSVRIDIKAYNGKDSLLINKVYDVEAINGAKSGDWSAEGCEIIKTENPNLIKIKPTSKTVKIIYRVGEQEKPRHLNAKQIKL